MSNRNHTTVQPIVLITYALFGTIALSALLFSPLGKTLTSKTSNPASVLTSAFTVDKVAAPVQQEQTQNTSSKDCYAWSGLTSDQSEILNTVLTGNRLISNLQTDTVPARFGLAVVMPGDTDKRNALTRVVASNGIDISKVIVLSNGNKAWPVGIFNDANDANKMKSALTSKGIYNMMIDSAPSSYSVKFNGGSTEFISKLNEFTKTRNIPTVQECSN